MRHAIHTGTGCRDICWGHVRTAASSYVRRGLIGHRDCGWDELRVHVENGIASLQSCSIVDSLLIIVGGA